MGSKSIRDGDSPSASSFLLPQLRHSRRGSLNSLSSANQIDKEALSQVLDQIHSSASQTETLTTFNEYTSPPASSSGPDTKGIASDLQGGLSGLYNRFRASVGNVKDVVNLGAEDAAVENASLKSPRAATYSPKPLSKSVFESVQDPSSSTSATQAASAPGSGRQSPLGSVETEEEHHESWQSLKPSTKSVGSASVSAKSVNASLAVLNSPPITLTLAAQPTTISPALADTNISAVKRAGANPDPISAARNTTPAESQRLTRNSRRQSYLAEPSSQGGADASGSTLQEGPISKISGQGGPKQQGDEPVPKDPISSFKSSDKPVVDGSRAASVDTVRPFPGLEDGPDETAFTATGSSSDPNNTQMSRPAMIVTNYGNGQDNIFSISTSNNARGAVVGETAKTEGGYQHLELPLRKTMAPPLITRTMNVFSQVKNKVLNKEYWMKDENARDCFSCGDSFSTFRRKHHCRTCGQIFDAKCTSLLSGEYFGQTGMLRVCKGCEGIIKGDDDSSEISDDGSLSIRGLRPRHGSTGASDILASPVHGSSPTNTKGSRRSPNHPDLTIPTMSIPATRKAGGDAGTKPLVLEIEAERTLVRPSSSRSLKAAFVNKSFSSGHRRFNSRHQFQRSFKPVDEDNAPFHQSPVSDKTNSARLPAFHDDNIIDPDLAPYLSDEGSSGDEQVGIMAALNGEGLSQSYDNERHGFSGLLASSRKARSRGGDKSVSGVTFASRDADTHSLTSSKTANLSRSKRRNLSVAGNPHLRPSPRGHRGSAAIPNLGLNIHESTSSSNLVQVASSANSAVVSRMIRSSSMRGAAAPAIELNNASLRHVRKLLHQLLQDSNVPNFASWEKALIPILLRATDDVNPDVQNGDDIDIRHYVKLKKIPGGRPGDTAYVSGLVFTKNLALKCMPRSMSHPNILILTFALEYARHQQHFMSLEPVIRQEREFLQNLVNRIAALRPQLLLVERNVSGLALEFLEQANIATAYNVKASVLEAVSRCCQTRIISSIDKLAIKPAQAGKCASFYLKTYVNEGRKKTYMFLSGCAKELGCTIVLRGDSDATLAKVKRITEFMIYVVYNLKLETCLMRDEFASIPANTEIGSMSPSKDHLPKTFQNILSDKLNGENSRMGTSSHKREERHSDTTVDVSNADVFFTRGREGQQAEKSKINLPDDDSVPEDIPMPTFYGDMVEEHQTKILSASPFVKFMQPYLLMRAREQERRLAYLKRLRDQDILEEQNVDEKAKPEKFDLIKPEMVHARVRAASKKVREVLHAVHDAEYDKALHNYQTQSKQWEAYIAGNINLFDPYAHQNIAVLYSVVCTVTTVPCFGPDLLALGFYNEHETDADFEADCTLGQYVEDLCLGANTACIANGCERKMFEHHRQYVHGEAQLSVFVERYPCKLRGLQDTILMWSICRICGKETQVMPMSDSTWKYSFGKYLELSFWSSELHARADVCPHDLHRNHLRYFGFKDMALRVHYDPITLLEIIVPRARITWKVDNDLRFKNELFTKIEERLGKFMLSVKARIKSINIESVVPEKSESCKQEVEKLAKCASDEHHALIQKLREKYMNSKHYEIIPLNRAIRATQDKVAEWDNAFADFDRNFFPSEKDIRRLATLQLKKIFLDRDESATSLASADDSTTISVPEEAMNEKTFNDDTPALPPQTRRMSPERTHDLLAAVVEKHVSIDNQPDQHQSAPATAEPIFEADSALSSVQGDLGKGGVQHLDLATSASLSDRLEIGQNSTALDAISTAPIEREAKTPQNKPHPSTNTNGPYYRDSVKATNVGSPEQSKFPDQNQTSGIPRPIDSTHRATRSNVSPTLSRAQSQPTHFRHEQSNSGQSSSAMPPSLSTNSHSTKPSDVYVPPAPGVSKPFDKKLSDRFGLSALKPSGVTAHSMIPRSIANRRKDSKVSNLAKHFEQLSREFEKERVRERRQRAAKSRQARAYPMAASKPIVQIYRNVHEAVEEREPSDEDILSSDQSHVDQEGPLNTINHMAKSTDSQTPGEGFHAEETTTENTEIEDNNNLDSRVGSDVEGEETRSDDEHSLLDDIQTPGAFDEHHALTPEEAQLDIKLDLPKHEKSSLMKMLTNFWAERSASGWQPLEYPLNATDHIFADSDIIVREDEPSSLIAFALGSEDYQAKLRSITEVTEPQHDQDTICEPQDSASNTGDQVEVERSLLRHTGTHLKYQFAEGSAKMLCKVFYAEQFDALRRKCGVSERIVESLSRCMKWDSKGGKTKSVFLKTLDDRFVLKSLSPIETQAFLRFAPAYFRIMSESLFHELPSVIAKMLGFYQIIIKNPVTGIEFNWFLLVMENLFYDRSPTRIFDLKGSMRNRRIQSTGEQNEVLLDENMVEFIYESPLFSREHSKKLLRASVWNDTLFLSRQNVMDYSLMIAIDENRKELVVGIIDCIRTYTWDKKLESWIKDRGKNRPTVTSPKEYKSRFREAMGRYVLQAPNCWHQFKAQQVDTRALRADDPGDDREVQVVGL
ncbi:MAG: 1-phosphatidylinositol-3-phosphate 5-kinase [Alectoria sarmentosa]|nr:MAG: 1-phosphatidylinositol-3-phosphate 5-kinase [Alectoria sarmentosa]